MKIVRDSSAPWHAASLRSCWLTSPRSRRRPRSPSRSTVSGGEVSFHDIGDTVAVADLRRDGYGVRASIAWGYEFHIVYNRRGGGTVEFRDFDIPEGTKVLLRMCYIDGWRDVKCSSWHEGEA